MKTPRRVVILLVFTDALFRKLEQEFEDEIPALTYRLKSRADWMT
jgi:hypothetical protein